MDPCLFNEDHVMGRCLSRLRFVLVLLVVVDVCLGAAQAMPLATSPAPPPEAASTMSACWHMTCVDGTQEVGRFESIAESMASRGVECNVKPLAHPFVGAGRREAPGPQASASPALL